MGDQNKYKFGSYGYIAMKNLKSAERNLEIDADVVVYNSQQAVEKILKEYIKATYFSADIESLLHTHKLHLLVKKSGIDKLSGFKSDIADLSNYYFDGRYPGIGYEEVTQEDALRLFNAAKQMVAIVESKIPRQDTGTSSLKKLNLS